MGDSWPEGAHCGGCRTFAGLWADGIEDATGRDVEFTDLTGSREPGLGNRSETSATLLNSIRNSGQTRAAIGNADVILIATGPNEIEVLEAPLRSDSCGGADGLDCVRDLGEVWQTNFDAILDEIGELRAGRPTAIRLVNAANAFLSVPEMAEPYEPDFPTTTGALIYQLLTDAICDAAAAHGAVCVDVRPLLNGATLIEPVDENSSESMRAVADALMETGLPELD